MIASNRDTGVSPYLLSPLRSYAKAIEDRCVREGRKKSGLNNTERQTYTTIKSSVISIRDEEEC